MPKGASSMAELLVSISTPALLIQKLKRPGSARLPLSLLTLITQPFVSRNNSKKNCVRTNGVRKLISMSISCFSGFVDSLSPAKITPAQLIRIWRRPNLSTTAYFKSKSPWSSVRSHDTAIACAGYYFAIASNWVKSLPTSTTLAPLFKYQYARQRPIPLEAPVISTTFSRK